MTGPAAEGPSDSPDGDDGSGPGWFAYAPLSGQVFIPRRGSAGMPVPPSHDPYRVRLMNEYTVKWPIWVGTDPARKAVVAEAVDDALTARLRAWADVFNAHYSYEHGWDDPHVAAAHRTEGEALRDALAAVLPEPWHVELHYWETNGA
ncbi:hypothetical protein ACH436_09635 [Isoptericola sp. NPDC019693]|uniref:hypothetical protein n=1 Tax=Isoptericola sp. NPDC019693 TaxID=3364009 RepID=UPI0037BDDE06